MRYTMIALSVLGSATLLFSCGNDAEPTLYDYETLITESSQNRTITMMENGRRSYTFSSPLMEGYSLATNPYQEFRRGIVMTTYTNDSLALQEATITANYAIYYERQKLWEAKGNVVIIKNNRDEGDTTVTGLTEVYTQQLFWNATTHKIYSNVDTKVLQPDGWHFGVGFDADDDLKNIHFRRYSSEVEFDMSQPDSVAGEQTPAPADSQTGRASRSGSQSTPAPRPTTTTRPAPTPRPAPSTSPSPSPTPATRQTSEPAAVPAPTRAIERPTLTTTPVVDARLSVEATPGN